MKKSGSSSITIPLVREYCALTVVACVVSYHLGSSRKLNKIFRRDSVFVCPFRVSSSWRTESAPVSHTGRLPCPQSALIPLGGIIVSAMFHNGWSVDEALARFPALATAAFTKRLRCKIPVLCKVIDLLVPLFTDSVYCARDLEAILKDVFGASRSMLSCSHASSIGTKFGLLVATLGRQPLCRLFTNYNGALHPDEVNGKRQYLVEQLTMLIRNRPRRHSNTENRVERPVMASVRRAIANVPRCSTNSLLSVRAASAAPW